MQSRARPIPAQCGLSDADGETQPVEPRFDCGGFGNDAVHRVPVTVR
jgi:hypothetical protein